MTAIVNQPAITVYGNSIRTTNAIEMSDAGKIGNLWAQFYQAIAPKLKDGASTFGVYYDYESDADGEFSILAGSDDKQLGLQTVNLVAGRYRQFSATGDMPQTVIELWQQIWQYYAHNKDESRAFTTDYEHYDADNRVSIYIALAD